MKYIYLFEVYFRKQYFAFAFEDPKRAREYFKENVPWPGDPFEIDPHMPDGTYLGHETFGGWARLRKIGYEPEVTYFPT